MLRYLLFIFFILIGSRAQAQFRPLLYKLDAEGSIFANIISKNDTLIVYGSSIDTLNKKWGVYLAKVDTLGKVLVDTSYYDATSHYLVELNYPISSDNNNYYITGNIYNRSNIFYKKFDANLNEIFSKEITSGSDVTYVNNILKINNNKFIVGGARSIKNKFIGFYHFIDSLGNVLESKTINETDKYGAYINNFYKINNNKILITGSFGITDTTYKSGILAIDSLGNITSSWISILNEHVGIQKLLVLSDSTLIYATRQSKVVNGEALLRTLLVKRDKNMNVLWQRTFNEEWSMFYNQPIDLKETPDGNYILAHDKGSIKNSTKPNVLLSCLFKFNSNGDSIWSREDTVIYSEKFGVANKMGGITVLPSGSIVVCGYSNAPIDGSLRSIAWLYKVNRDGCMDYCNTTGLLDVVPEAAKLIVFPNPSSDGFTVQFESNGSYQLTVLDYLGRSVIDLPVQGDRTEVDTKGWPPGVYLVRVEDFVIHRSYTQKIIVQGY